jgi:hypothetical protein
MKSNASEKLGKPEAQGFGDSHEGVDACRLFAAFNLPEVNGMQVGLFRELFLAHFCRLAMFSYRLADCLLMG